MVFYVCYFSYVITNLKITFFVSPEARNSRLLSQLRKWPRDIVKTFFHYGLKLQWLELIILLFLLVGEDYDNEYAPPPFKRPSKFFYGSVSNRLS